jgi:hypothetical protein
MREIPATGDQQQMNFNRILGKYIIEPKEVCLLTKQFIGTHFYPPPQQKCLWADHMTASSQKAGTTDDLMI